MLMPCKMFGIYTWSRSLKASAILPVATDIHRTWTMCLTVLHLVKAVGRNEISFGWNTGVVSSNTALERGFGIPRETEIWGSTFALQTSDTNVG